MNDRTMVEIEKEKKNIIKRLNRIEGQVKGIKRMVEANKCCSDVLVQVSAVRSATNKVGLKILENYSKTCVEGLESKEEHEEVLNELLSTLERYMKFSG